MHIYMYIYVYIYIYIYRQTQTDIDRCFELHTYILHIQIDIYTHI